MYTQAKSRSPVPWVNHWSLVFVTGLSLFLMLALAVSTLEIIPAERAFYQWLVGIERPTLPGIFGWINELGDRELLIPFALLVPLALPLRSYRRWWLLLAVVLLSWGVEDLTKSLIERSRPAGGGASFPSDHAAAAAAFFVILAYTVRDTLRKRVARVLLWVGATTCILLVMLVHAYWPLDTIAGAALGLACAAAAAWWNEATLRPARWSDHSSEEGPRTGAAADGKQRRCGLSVDDEDAAVPLLLRPLYYLYRRRLLRQVSAKPIPRHVGIILDGNRRHARQHGLSDPYAIYRRGAQKLDAVLDWCGELRIPAVTLWVFSTENFKRSPQEVSGILAAVETKIAAIARDPLTHRRCTRVRAIGRIDLLPAATVAAIRAAEEATSSYDGMVLTIAVGYGGREEIASAVRKLLAEQAEKGATLPEMIEQITPAAIARYLYTADLPDPDLIIRTSGEIRLSGFLLWQSAHSEYYFTDVLWPDLRKIDFLRAIRAFQYRARRFGE